MCSRLNKRQKATFACIREIPVRSDVSWSDIIDLLSAIGEVKEYKDRVFALVSDGQGMRRGVFHRRKRRRYANEKTVQGLQDFLIFLDID